MNLRIHLSATSSVIAFLFMVVNTHAQLLISEIMHRPKANGNPWQRYDWIEITNFSNAPIQLNGWRIQVNNNLSAPLPYRLLLPDSSILVGSTTTANRLSNYSTIIGVTRFPALPNTTATLLLRTPSGTIQQSIGYQLTWHWPAIKQGGGWSLELQSSACRCWQKNNWTSSVDTSGATPNKKNSTFSLRKDTSAPQLLHSIATTPFQIRVDLNESIDTTTLQARQIVLPNNTVTRVEAIAPFYQSLVVHLNSPLEKGKAITLKMGGISDCAGNKMGATDALTGLPEAGIRGKIWINEIMYKPSSTGMEYIELGVQQLADAATLAISRNQNGPFIPLRSVPLLLTPNQYPVFAASDSAIYQQHPQALPHLCFATPSFPALPNEGGKLYLALNNGIIIDSIVYSPQDHHPLISNSENVALERIGSSIANYPTVWTSAAATAGYATPTQANSVNGNLSISNKLITLSTKEISPNGDGYHDICLIQTMPEMQSGLLNIWILNQQGLIVKRIAANQTIGQNAVWQWQGYGENHQRLPSGIYIIVAEWYNLEGKKRRQQQTISLWAQ